MKKFSYIVAATNMAACIATAIHGEYAIALIAFTIALAAFDHARNLA